MKKTAKKILSLCMAVAMMAGMAITAFAAETGDVAIKTGYTIPGVISVDTVKASRDDVLLYGDVSEQWLFAGDYKGTGSLADVKVYTVRVGTKIDLAGFTGAFISNSVKFENNILCYDNGGLRKLNDELTYDLTCNDEFSESNGRSYEVFADGAHFTFMKEGYYALTVYDERTSDLTSELADNGAVVIKVVGENTPTTPPAEKKITATATSSKVLVNGTAVEFDAYTINENNYFKLRDIAQVLSGSAKQFEVTWDGANNAINLVSSNAYTVVGGELAKGDGTAKNAVTCTATILKDGVAVTLTAYTINGNNYFKLRDLGQAFDFDVSWDGANNCIVVDANSSYTAV